MKKFFAIIIIFSLCFGCCLAIPEKSVEFKKDLENSLEKVLNGSLFDDNIPLLEKLRNLEEESLDIEQKFLKNKDDLKLNKIYINRLYEILGEIFLPCEIIENEFYFSIIYKYNLEFQYENDCYHYYDCCNFAKLYLKKYKIDGYKDLMLYLKKIFPIYKKTTKILKKIQKYSVLKEKKALKTASFKNLKLFCSNEDENLCYDLNSLKYDSLNNRYTINIIRKINPTIKEPLDSPYDSGFLEYAIFLVEYSLKTKEIKIFYNGFVSEKLYFAKFPILKFRTMKIYYTNTLMIPKIEDEIKDVEDSIDIIRKNIVDLI